MSRRHFGIFAAVIGLVLVVGLMAGPALAKGGAKQAPVNDKHNITDPYTNPTVWLNTMKSTRVAELFKTPGGLNGHVQQVQQEIDRLISERNQRAKLEGQNGADLVKYTHALSELRNALISSAGNAKFDFPKFGIRFAPLGSDLYLERVNGKLKVDGRPA